MNERIHDMIPNEFSLDASVISPGKTIIKRRIQQTFILCCVFVVFFLRLMYLRCCRIFSSSDVP